MWPFRNLIPRIRPLLDAREASRALRVMRMIDTLTADEGESVEFLCVDPESWEKGRTIDVCGSYTNWQTLRIRRNTIYDALTVAVNLKGKHHA